MSSQNINSVISVIPVNDFDKALSFYVKLFGRGPDIVPMEGIAEWEIVENAWIQVSIDPERAGTTTVVVGVNDIEAQCKECTGVNIAVGEIEEYPGIIKMMEMNDPDGNKISYVQDISNNSGI
jgi:predicted enzyme related to lactoylglutathione lyase